MQNSSEDGPSVSIAFASMSDELHPATEDQTRGVRQSLEQIRSLTSDATERLIGSVLGNKSTPETQARLGLKHFVQDTADILRDVLADLDEGRSRGDVRRRLRTRLALLAEESGITVEPSALEPQHIHDLGRRMGSSVTEVMQSLQVDDLVNQLADEILGRLDRLDVLSEQIEQTAGQLADADPDEMRRFAERLLELSVAIGRMREEWAGAHKSVSQGEMNEGDVEIF